MDIIELLKRENDSEKIKKCILNKNLILFINENFKANPKILLTCFLFYKNSEEFSISKNSKLYKYAKELTELLLEYKEIDKINLIYKDYEEEFVKWKNDDLDEMIDDISNTKDSFLNMLIENPSEVFDIQWNEGINKNIKTMDESLEKLDYFSKSPPKFIYQNSSD